MELSYDEGSANKPPTPPDAAATADTVPQKAVPLSSVSFIPKFSFLKEKKLDNLAVATTVIEENTRIVYKNEDGKDVFLLTTHTILEGHRFAIRDIKAGEELLSWGLPFAVCTSPIKKGEYLCNIGILEALRARAVPFRLPTKPNFKNLINEYSIEGTSLDTSPQIPMLPKDVVSAKYFTGFDRRSEGRGVGTRNYVLIIGTTALTASFARMVQHTLNSRRHARRNRGGKPLLEGFDNVDGVCAIGHTEGMLNQSNKPHNLELLFRTLAGWVTHPNIGAALVLDRAKPDQEAITCDSLRSYIKRTKPKFASSSSVLEWMTVSGDSRASNLKAAQDAVMRLLPLANRSRRVKLPVSHIKLALQCGGSDAFSGVSANPLAGSLARKLIQYGGAALQAETDELMGAESYFLRKVKNKEVAEEFLRRVRYFKDCLKQHGQSAEGNPSAGNNYRGLYNIALKSLGAAMKKSPDVRLDGVMQYSESYPDERGFYFMDSPGNDIESVAGQVASGSNMIIFTTGNGAVTNFPFVPTIKVISTSNRYKLVHSIMDFNAGRMQDGESMGSLTDEIFDLCLSIASGAKSIGEVAGNSQVSIWRNYWQKSMRETETKTATPPPTTTTTTLAPPLPSGVDEAWVKELLRDRAVHEKFSAPALNMMQAPHATAASPLPGGYTGERVGLVLPTSLCSSSIAKMCADRLNNWLNDASGPTYFSRFVALPHTEGCGSKGKTIRDNYDNILVGHLTHPLVASALILEHGCESEHNEEMKKKLTTRGVALTRKKQKQIAEVSGKAATVVGEQKTEDAFGWASVQYDGGIQNVYAKAQKWFQEATLSSLSKAVPAAPTPSWRGVGVGFMCAPHYPLTHAEGRVVALAVTAIVRAGGFVVVPQHSPLLREARFLDVVLETRSQLTPTLLYGQSIAYSSKGAKSPAGLHIMAEDSSSQWIETLTALASTGVQCTGVLSHTAMATNPLVPTLTVMPSNKRKGSDDADSTLFLGVGVGETEAEMHGRCARALLEDIAAVLSRKRMPQSMMLGDLAFQLSRGKMGVSV